MSKITINDKWRMNYDGVQFTPEYWREGYTKEDGKEVEPAWINCKKYYPNEYYCLKYIISQDVLHKGDMSLDEFLVEYKATGDELKELLEKALGGL